MIDKKIFLFFLFFMSGSITTVKTSYNAHEYSSCAKKFYDFFTTLSPSEKGAIERRINYFSNLTQKNHNLQSSLDALKQELDNSKQELDNSMNRKYRDLTIMIGEGVIIASLLCIVYKLFHRNKLYREAEETLPEAQKTVSLKKNEQLAPKDAILQHNYNTFAKYTDKLNTIQQKLEECNRSPHDNDSIESCLKEIASISKAPI